MTGIPCVCFWPLFSSSHAGQSMLDTFGKPLAGFPMPEFLREDSKTLLAEVTEG